MIHSVEGITPPACADVVIGGNEEFERHLLGKSAFGLDVPVTSVCTEASVDGNYDVRKTLSKRGDFTQQSLEAEMGTQQPFCSSLAIKYGTT